MREIDEHKMEELSPTIITILEPHFERFTSGFITNFIQGCSENDPINGMVQSFKMIYNAIHNKRDEYLELLNKTYLDNKDNSSYRNLNVLSMHCSGDLVNDDPIIIECSRLSIGDVRRIDDLSEVEKESYLEKLAGLKINIAEYIKGKSSSLLSDRFPHLNSNFARDSSKPQDISRSFG